MNNTLYYKDENGKYQKWGTTFAGDALCLPFGLWLVIHNTNSSASSNIIVSLANEDEIINVKVILQRIKIKEVVQRILLDSDNLSINELANKIAKELVPEIKDFNIRDD